MVGTFTLVNSENDQNQAWLPDAAYLRTVSFKSFAQLAYSRNKILEYAMSLTQQWGLRFLCVHVLEEARVSSDVFKLFGFLRDPKGDILRDGKLLEGYYLDLSFAPNL